MRSAEWGMQNPGAALGHWALGFGHLELSPLGFRLSTLDSQLSTFRTG